MWEDRANLQVTEMVKVFLDRVDKVADPEFLKPFFSLIIVDIFIILILNEHLCVLFFCLCSYLPSQEDILLARIKTTGITHEEYNMEGLVAFLFSDNSFISFSYLFPFSHL